MRECVFVMDGSCCGGKDVDPHAVLRMQTKTGAFFLLGKMIDSSGMADGFVVKVPSSLSNRKIFLHEEKFNV